MIHPRIDDLLEHVDSRYALVIVAAKRARQINNYHHQLGEGIGFEEAPPPLIESRSKNYLTMAMEEISQGKIAYEYTPLGARTPILTALTGTMSAGGADPPRRDRWDRGLQGLRARAPARQGRARRRAARHARGRALRPRPRPSGRSRAEPASRTRTRICEHADLLVVAPLTAHTLARLAHGLADDVLTEAALAHDGPVLVAPGDEPPHVGAPGDAGERRDCCGRAASS